jgi:hypothetical protein
MLKLKTYNDLKEECAKHTQCRCCPVEGKVKCLVDGHIPTDMPEYMLQQEIMKEDHGRWDGFYV